MAAINPQIQKSNMEITIGEIQNKLDTIIFSEKSRHKEREKILKDYINLCAEMSIQLVKLPHEKGQKISHYKEVRIKRSLKRICDYLGYLASELEKDKILKFCDNQNLFFSPSIDINISFLFANSYYGSIETDLYWIENITLIEALEISSGKFDFNKLSKKLPNTVSEFTKIIIPFIKKDILFSKFTDILIEIEKTYKSKLYKACNLLILTSIEGMVRELGNYLIDKQNLEVKNYESLNSLDSFLRNIEWKKDFSIGDTRYKLLTGDYDFTRNEHPLKPLDINLKERLDFLRRRFKEDRDLILHGIDKEYGKEWHLFVNFSAMINVYETIKYYRNLYK